MKRIFGLLFFIILICLIYLYYQGKISRNIPIIFMFFIILIIPFTYLEKKNDIESFTGYDQIMNSSLDIFYTNKKKERRGDWLKKYPILNNPLQARIVENNLKPIELYLYNQDKTYNGIYLIYNNLWNAVYLTYQTPENIFTYLTSDDFKTKNFTEKIKSRVKKFTNLGELKTLIESAPLSSYIVILANNIQPIFESDATTKNTFKDKYKFTDWIDTNQTGSLIAVLSKVNNDTYTSVIERAVNNTSFLNFYQTIKFNDVEVRTNGGALFKNVPVNENIRSIENDPLIQSKINIISPVNLSPDYSLSITVENNESFVYLSSRKLADEVVLYAKSPKNDVGPTSTTYLDTQKPQFWSFEPVTPIITDPLIVFIRTYSKPYFYLDAEMENGIMVLKAKRFKAGLRQHWELIKNPANTTQYKLRHLQSKKYLAYSDYDGYLYNNDGSVFLTNSDKYNWNIKMMSQGSINKNVIEGFESNKKNTFTGMEVPTDFGTVKNPSFKISKNIGGKNIVIASKGRTLWEPNFGPIWSGKWIYYGTVDSYKATLSVNDVKFLIIKINATGSGIVDDEYLGYKMNVINAGSNILTGIIPSGRYKGYRATLELLETSLEYSDPSDPFPVKMRYFIEQGQTRLNLSSGNVKNMQGYSTKFVSDRLILSNFLEASGIQTDPKLAFSSKDLQKMNDNIKNQTNISNSLKIAKKYIAIKSSKLLYRATRDGWNAGAFHRLCDNKGATVTIAILQDGRIIGAYSPISWGKTNGYINNSQTFLFDSDKKYSTIESAWGRSNYAIYQTNTYGPTFGGGHDFLTLASWSPMSLGNNAWTYLNNGKGPLGVNRYSYNNYQLKELEVFSVTIDVQPDNKWQMLSGYPSPMRLNEDGNVECLSYNGRDCEWGYLWRFGKDLNNIDVNRVDPLTCGEHHRTKWGTDGYYEGHWCNNLRRQFNRKVVVYEHGNYQGRSLELGIGTYGYNYLNSRGFNDVISSLRVPPGIVVEAWEHNPGEGRKWTYDSDTNWVGDANDRISSLIVKKKVDQSNDFQKLDNTNCVYGRLYNGYRRDGDGYNYLGDYDSYKDCLKNANIPISAKAITYHNERAGGWAKQCFSINDNNTKVSNQNYATCGIRTYKPKIMYGPWIGSDQKTEIRKLNNGEGVYIMHDSVYTKMVSTDGQEKYFEHKGRSIKFDPSNWNSYNNTGGGKYLLKDDI